MDIRVYEEALKKLEHEIECLNKKETLSAAEVDNLTKAVKAAKEIIDIIGEMPQDAGESYGKGVTGSYSLRPGFKREIPGYMPDYSYRRGRSATTGRYMSRGMHDMNYSGHSIHDRMIAKLEELFDEGIGPYEQEVVHAGIRMIEQNK